jgi:DNA primase
MALDPAFLDELRARLPIASVIGRRTKLIRSGRNFKACCPFHGEKTPSFHVYDDHFHCFGCGAHGDIISFVMQSEGRSFIEAIEQLAGEAGLDVPRSSPAAVAAARAQKTLGEVLDAVQASYRRRLYMPEGREGLTYLRKRGLSDATIEAFGLGWSGDGRGSLIAELEAQQITRAQLAEAGMMRFAEDGSPRGELFFNRVTFPIRDRRGRLVSFGGRTLGDAQPKYLNGPETAVFSKRRTLFNLDRAREAVRKGCDLVVVEGYMDAIMLHQAGFEAAVAPLGTAMGAEQLEALWQVSPDPILCLDGDAAGQRATFRTIETALPLLGVEKTLRVCQLPERDDPDSLIARGGPEAMAAALSASAELVDALYRAVAAGAGTSPEARAGLRARLVALAGLIADGGLSSEYRRALLDRYFAQNRKPDYRKGERGARPQADLPVARHEPGRGNDERLNMLTAILLRHPDVLGAVEAAYCRLELPPDLALLREALLEWSHQFPPPEPASFAAWMETQGFGTAARAVLDSDMPRTARVDADDLLAIDLAAQWWHYYGLLNVEAFAREVAHDVEAAIARAYEGDGLDVWPEALAARVRALDALRRGSMPDDDV